MFLVSTAEEIVRYITKPCMVKKGGWFEKRGFKWTVQAETEWDVMSLGDGDVNSADFQKGLLVNGHIPTQTKAAAGGDGQLRYDLALLDGGETGEQVCYHLHLFAELSGLACIHTNKNMATKISALGGGAHEHNKRGGSRAQQQQSHSAGGRAEAGEGIQRPARGGTR